MSKFDSFKERPIISLDEMKENETLVLKAFYNYVEIYYDKAKKKNGIMTIADMNDTIENTINKLGNITEKESFVVEGFLELIMGMLKTYGNSTDTFKKIKKMFGWR